MTKKALESDEAISAEGFRRDVLASAGALEARGFKRAPEFERESSTTASIVYLGRHVAFTFELDIRDQAIDLTVTRCRDGRLVSTWDGGYSSSVFGHLVTHCGFRGRPVPQASLPSSASKAQRRISALVGLLFHPCAAGLLEDRADALGDSG